MSRPAALTFAVKDSAGKPISGATVTARPVFGKGPHTTALTDDAGTAILRLTAPGDEITWMSQIDIDKGPTLHFQTNATLFPDAQLTIPGTLKAADATLVQVLGPKGETPAYVPLQFEYILINAYGATHYDERNNPALRTNDQGQYLWRHPTLKSFQVSAGGKTVASPSAEKVTIQLSQEQYNRVLNTHIIEGQLFLPDGKPAEKWQVVNHTERRSGGGIVAGIAIPVDIYRGDEVQHPGPDGSFRIVAPSEFLTILSPEGIPFIFALSPQSWAGNPHRLVLTTPVEKDKITGQLVDEAGKAMVGVRVSINSMRTDGGMWRMQLGEGSSSSIMDNYLDNVDAGEVVSDAEGRFSYPVYAGAKPDGTFIFGEASQYYSHEHAGSDAKLILRRYATNNRPPSAMKDVTVRFVDSKGQEVTDLKFDKVTASPVGDGLADGV
ncbi:MAG TPA: carboxypeptidase-like regulatory domain-containing protein, partial [Phycisphaerae bacterium]|nr:carboxypeptidase-like regulatory domain-containing protein [Phycisphaerae bacterium]